MNSRDILFVVNVAAIFVGVVFAPDVDNWMSFGNDFGVQRDSTVAVISP